VQKFVAFLLKLINREISGFFEVFEFVSKNHGGQNPPKYGREGVFWRSGFWSNGPVDEEKMENHPPLPSLRRTWLKTACQLASMPLVLGSDFGFPREVNNQLEIGVIGLGARGKYLIANLPSILKVTALCDCALRRIDSVKSPQKEFAELLKDFASNTAPSCRIFQDYREMLSTMRLDAVIIATPDHHHASMAITAMRAGCHVYLEKPLATTIREGRAIVDAAQKFDRIVQVGSQQRSMQINRIACEFIRDGGLGRVHRIVERNLPGPIPYEANFYPKQEIPSDLNWDLFCGPTPLRDYHPNLWIKEEYKIGKLLWRGWDLIDDYSGHLMTNWGGHSLDMVQYALGMDNSGPIKIEVDRSISDEGFQHYNNKTPPIGTCSDNRMDESRFWPIQMTYANGTVLSLEHGQKEMIFFGERGKITVTRNRYICEPENLLPPMDVLERQKWDGQGNVAKPHLENWIAAIRNGSALNAPVEVGHRTATACHLANIARIIGSTLHWNPEQESFIGNDEASRLLQRDRRPGFELK
jgi:predicted dehydrogenase